MANEKMITRTVKRSSVDCLVFDKTTKATANVTIYMPDKFTEKELAKEANKLGYVLCEMVEVNKTETLYGLPESIFMKYAEILPPRAINKEEG